MKKLLSLMLVLAMVLSFAACNSGGGNESTAPSESGSAGGSETEANVPVLEELAAIVEKGYITVGMECNYAPFNWLQASESENTVAVGTTGFADGYDVQIAKKIAEALGVELKIAQIEWDGLSPALVAGTIDMIIAGMSPTAERKLTIDFSDFYYQSQLVLVVKKDGAYAQAAELADFSGAKVTGQLNTFHYSVIDQIEGVVKETAMSDFPAMITALKAGTIDAYVSELPGAVSAVAANSELSYIEFAEGKGFTASVDDTAVSVGIRKGSDLAGKINEALAGITEAQRLELMNAAVARQPVVEE